jgi:putative addiction module component (TIGR02574 family)
MTAVARKLAKQALALPGKDRAQLASLLFRSLDAPGEKLSRKEWSNAWKSELERRLEDLRSGKVAAIPAGQVMAELRAKYG